MNMGRWSFLLRQRTVLALCMLMASLPGAVGFAQSEGAEGNTPDGIGEAAVQPEQSEPSETVSGSEPVPPLEVAGTVLLRGKGTPLAGVLVFDTNDRKTFTKTDAQGRYRLKLQAGVTSVSFRRSDFDEVQVDLTPQGLAGGLTTFMERSATYREVGIIRARRKTEISQQSLSREDLSNIAGSGGDAVRGLQTLPSVLATNAGSAQIVVRGGAPGDNKFYFDRLELPFVYHLGGLGTVLPLRALSGVDLFAGGFSALYPDVTSAVVQLKSDTEVPERFSGEVELSLIQSSFFLEGSMFGDDDSDQTEGDSQAAAEAAAEAGVSKATGIGYRLGFRRSYLELFVPLLLESAGADLSITTVPQITDYQILFNGAHSRGTWQYYLVGAANRLALAAPTGQTDDQSGRSEFKLFNYFEVMGFRYSLDLAPGLGLTFVPQQSFVLVDQQFGNNIVKVRSSQYSLDVALSKTFGRQVSATAGVRPQWDFTTTDVDAIQIPAGGFTPFFDPDTAPRSAEKRRRQTTHGSVYLDALIEPSESVTINPGVVYLRGRTKEQQEIDPRLATRWELNETHALKAAWGQYSQLPNPAFDAPAYGNPDLKLERSDHYVAGWEYGFATNWMSDFQFYTKELYNLVGTATSQPQDRYENNIKGRAHGAEILVRKSPSGRYDGSVSYGYSVSERLDPVTNKWRLSGFDRTHNFSLVAKYKVTGKWTLGTRFQYLTGDLDSSISGGQFNQNTGRYLPVPAAEFGILQTNDIRNPDFMQLDLRSDYDIWFDTWTLSWFVEVQLAPPGGNVVATNWNNDFSKRSTVRGLPFLPNAGIKASF
jgi:hypothetical protein